MAKVSPPTTSTTWNVYIKTQTDALPDQSLAARRLFKRNLKLEKIAQVERLARGANTATNFRSNNIYVSPGTRSPTPHSPWGSLTFAYQDGLSNSQTTFGEISVDLLAWSTELGIFVAINNQYDKCATSPDGVTWTLQPGYTVAATGVTSYMTTIIWNGQQFVALGLRTILRSADGKTWTRHLISRSGIQSSQQSALCWSSTLGKFLTAGRTGDVWTSTDAVNWFRSNGNLANATGMDAVAAVWSPELNIFVAIGYYNQASRCATSPDGDTWTLSPSFETAYTNNCDTGNPMYIRWDGTQFIAAGTGVSYASYPRRCATSPDGVNWTSRNIALSSAMGTGAIVGLAQLGSRYVILSDTVRVATSINSGTTWQTRDIPPIGSTGKCIAANTGQFIVGGELGKIAISTSTNASPWFYQDGLSLSQTQFGLNQVQSVAWDGKKYLIISNNRKAATSPDGKTWTVQLGLATALQNYPTHAVNWNGQQFLVTGGALNNPRAATSPDGITWEALNYADSYRNTMKGGNSSRIAWHNNQYVVIGGDQGEQWRSGTSADGLSWTTGNLLFYGTYGDMASNGTRLVIPYYNIGEYGADAWILTSTNGLGWSISVSGLTFLPERCAWNGLYFMITGGHGQGSTACMTSTDGTNWTELSTRMPFAPRLLKTFGSQFIIISSDGQMATSTDNGVTWITRLPSLPGYPTDILYNTTTSNFIAVGGSGEVWTS